jgi:alpha-N-arabinofuranosidase
VLTSDQFTDFNDFGQAAKVKPAVFSGVRKDGNDVVVEMPAKSIVVLELK